VSLAVGVVEAGLGIGTDRLRNFNGNKGGLSCVVSYDFMMMRVLLLFLIAGGLRVWASQPINAPMVGASASVSQPHVTAELIPERTNIQPGEPFDVALHLHSDKDWHTYWINPGDAGLATTIKWTLPPGFTAGPIQWPTPEKHNMGPLVTYGYEGDVYLLTTITPPKNGLPTHFDVKAHAEWLVCQEECIPGKADFDLPLDSGLTLRLPVENKLLFTQARERLPVEDPLGDVDATYENDDLAIQIEIETAGVIDHLKNIQFFLEQPNVLDPQAEPRRIRSYFPTQLLLQIKLVQNGDKPNQLSGVLVSDDFLFKKNKAIHFSSFSVKNKSEALAVSTPSPQTTGSDKSAAVSSGDSVSQSNDHATVPPLGTAAATTEGSLPVASSNPDNEVVRDTQGNTSTSFVAGMPATTATAQPWLIAVLGAAFVGGLILNLMPCVLPVLSLKVFSLMRHAGENPRGAWKQGVAFTGGVVLSFWVLAGLLLALRAAGNQLGWGFQMQSPGFVLALIFLFFLLGLNLFGVFELGTSLVGLDAKVTGRFHGLTSSFLNGALATVAATPCTAPFMGSALGFAAQQPAVISLIVFTFLALGMATPYLLLTIFPGALRFVPKPGAWMEAFKQFMGFLLMATVIFLIYVFGALVGVAAIPGVLFTLLFFALAAWIYGRWGTLRWFRYSMIALGVYAILNYDSIAIILLEAGGTTKTDSKEHNNWQPWSPEAVDAELAQGRPVFVDFTAAWCLSCKVNERVALDTDAVKKAFAEKNVTLFRADWTHSDAKISETLRQYNRDGVPLYLLYSPKEKDKPQVLPEVLTPGIVLEAMGKL